MYKLLSSLAIVLFLSSGVLAQEWAWKNFSPTGKPWSVLAPGEMQPDEEAQQSRSKMGSYSYSDFYGYFAVVYRDAPKTFLISLKPDAKAHFKKVKNDFITASKGQLLKEEDFESGRAKGRELFIKIPSGTITGLEGQVITKYRIERLRMFFIGRRFFMLLAVLPEDIVNTPQVDKFFNSFSTNTAPQAVADSYLTDEDTVLTINSGRGVLANDTDEENDNLSVSTAKPQTLPAHGTLLLNADGSFNYRPEANFNGTDSFTYKTNDGQADSAETTVIIKINSVNDAPTVSNLPPSSTLDELTPLSFAAMASDIDSPANSLRFSLSEAPSGAVIDPVSGAVKWTPSEAQGPANYTFRVNVSDGSATASETINVAVKEVNSAPILAGISAQTVDELKPLSLTANGSDTDAPVNTLTYSLGEGAPSGMAIDSKTGAISWTPSEAQGAGSYNVTFRVMDNGAPSLSAEETVTITVKEVNTSPVAGNAEINGVEDRSVSFALNASDVDLPSNTLKYLIVANPQNGSLSGSGLNLTYTPKPDFNGSDSFTFKVNDGAADSAAATISIKIAPVNDAPTANPDSAETKENVPVNIIVTANDKDIDGDKITVTNASESVGGTVKIGLGGNVQFTPNQDFRGTGSFKYTISDGNGGTAVGSVTVTVNPATNK